MSTQLQMMAEDYERRAIEQRGAAEHFKARGMKAWIRAAQNNARRYEREAASIRESIARTQETAQ